MTESINCLLTQKPEGRAPEQGEIKCYAIEQKVSKNGKPWTKARNSTPDKGGSNYRILNVQQTDFVDAHGNVSYNVELGKAAESWPDGTGTSTALRNGTPTTPQDDPVKAAKAHLARAANGMLLCLEAVNYVRLEYDSTQAGSVVPKMTDEQFQAITSTLFINLDKSGLIQTLPVAKPEPDQF